MRANAREIARLLAQNIFRLVLELLPNGHRAGAEWVHPSLVGTSRRSLSVRLTGPKAGVYSDFSSGEAGDALDLVAALLFGGDKRLAITWACHWLGAKDTRAAQPDYPGRSKPCHSTDDDKQARQSAALRIFSSATAQIAGTPVDAYLRSRGINLAELERYPPSIRYHPALRNRERGTEPSRHGGRRR